MQSRSQYVTSSKQLFSFTINLLKGKSVNILSVLNDKLLVSCNNSHELFTYCHEGSYLSTITLKEKHELYDATWTPCGNIVCTTENIFGVKVFVMSECGEIITTHTQMSTPLCLSVSNNNIIYLADFEDGIYQSSNDGVTWSLSFKPTKKEHCSQVIKVTDDDCDDFWTLWAKNACNLWRYKGSLSVYSIDRRLSDGKIKTSRNITIPSIDGEKIDLLQSKMSYDGYMNIFLSNWGSNAVHVLSADFKYQSQLLRSKNTPMKLAIHNERPLLYVGQWDGLIEVFELTYGD